MNIDLWLHVLSLHSRLLQSDSLAESESGPKDMTAVNAVSI